MACSVCHPLPCVCTVAEEDTDAWLFKEDEPELTAKEFLDWRREQGWGDMPSDEPIDIPWAELVKLIGIVLTLIGAGNLNPDDVARRVLPLIRGDSTSARGRA